MRSSSLNVGVDIAFGLMSGLNLCYKVGMNFIYIAPHVRDLLGANAELEMCSAAMANNPYCTECGRRIALRGGDTANLRLVVDPNSHYEPVQFAHTSCAPSDVVHGRVSPRAIADGSRLVNFIGLLRTARPNFAMLVEPRMPMTSPPGVSYGYADAMRDRGLVSVCEPLASCAAPLASSWACWFERGDLVIADGSFGLVRYEGMRAAFVEALRRDGGLLLLVAADFGLEAPDLARIDIVLASGRAVGGIVTFRR